MVLRSRELGRVVAKDEWVLTMPTLNTNLRSIGRSRRKPEAGDIFIAKPNDQGYLAGRVIISEPPAHLAPGPSCILVYIYGTLFQNEEVDVDVMTPGNLLIPPLWTNRLAWKLGYFKHIVNVPLVAANMLTRHCFRDAIPRFGAEYLDEMGRPISDRIIPCGNWSLVSYRWIDDRISDALGITRAPETT